jgi:transposase
MLAVPGIGPMTATATVAAIGNGSAFKKGRGFAAWLGVVPGEHSTGGKQTLTDTSRRVNRYPPFLPLGAQSCPVLRLPT